MTTNIKLILPQTKGQSLVLNQHELRQLNVGGLSYNLYDLLSHYQSIEHLCHGALLLPTPGVRFLDCTQGFNKIVESDIYFRSSIDGRKLVVKLDNIKQLEAVFDAVFYPNEIADKALEGNRLIYLPYGALADFSTQHGDQYNHRLYVTSMSDRAPWDELRQKQVAWVESDLPLTSASKSIAFVSDSQLALDSDTYRMAYQPLADDCSCYTCQHFTRAYLHHLLKQTPLLAIKLVAIHNLADMIYHS